MVSPDCREMSMVSPDCGFLEITPTIVTLRSAALFDSGTQRRSLMLDGDGRSATRGDLAATKRHAGRVLLAALATPSRDDPLDSVDDDRKPAVRAMGIKRRHVPSPQAGEPTGRRLRDASSGSAGSEKKLRVTNYELQIT
jgi:hypothetical protein